jgi:hypothetical protein
MEMRNMSQKTEVGEMATAKAKLRKLASTPEALAADRVWKQIEGKLNWDGRYGVLNVAESMLRLGSLTNEEGEYLGKFMGWDVPYFNNIDWENVPSNFLAACVMEEDHGTRILQYAHPAPATAPVFESATSDEIEDFLAGDITFDELRERYPAQEVK